MMDDLVANGALVAYTLLLLTLSFAPFLLGFLTTHRTGKIWAGCVVGGVVLIAALIILAPTLGYLWDISCQLETDVESCMEDG